MSARAFAVLGKELVDHLRDRRSMTTALLSALLGPLGAFGLFSFAASLANTAEPAKVLLVGAENAPSLVAFLEQAGAEITTAPADYEALIGRGDASVALIIPKGYGEQFAHGKPASLQLVSDSANGKTAKDVARVRRMLELYSSQVGALRLVARGVDPKLAAPVAIDEVDVATRRKRAGALLSVIPLFLMMAAFLGGMYAAIDAMAGERERGSLEPLLLTPVERIELVVGKWLAVVCVAGVALLITLLGFAVAIPRIPFEDLGIQARFGLAEVCGILILYGPLLCLSSALQLLASTFARSFKEAQSYVQLLVFIPIVPGMILSVDPAKPASWMAALPLLGQEILATELIKGEVGFTARLFAAVPGTALVMVLCLALTARLLREERIVFGR